MRSEIDPMSTFIFPVWGVFFLFIVSFSPSLQVIPIVYHFSNVLYLVWM